MTGSVDLRVGIDVGGTNTDAVVLDVSDRVLAKAKTPTTSDTQEGVSAVLNSVVRAPNVSLDRITHVMLGTTHATNAVLERHGLYRVAVVRVAGPASHSIPPLFDWPADLRSTVLAGKVIVDGGSELSGQELAEFGRGELARFLGDLGEEVDAVAITGVFSPVAPDHELAAEEVVGEVLGDIPVSLSHGIGALGLLERENACVLNAALLGVANRIVNGLTQALVAQGIEAQVFIAQNDGTLMGLEYVLRNPVLTIGSGPANSMRGAAFLTGVTDALVVDVGGTSTDVGVMSRGYPRESSAPVDIGGVRTNFRMPDLVSVALGGGTIVRRGGDGLAVGPTSVGYRIGEEAIVFGGSTSTLTDAAVWAGRAAIGDPSRLVGKDDELEEALVVADQRLADVIDAVKTSKADVPLVAVGGGSILVPDAIPGVSVVQRPENYDVANAIGAAIASVSGQVDRVYKLGENSREEALRQASEAARMEAVAAGADPGTTEIVELEEVPMAYLTEPVVRIRAKAAGNLGIQ